MLVLLRLKQQALTWRLRALESDLDTEWDRPVHRVAAATEAEPLQVLAAPSVFAWGASFKGQRGRRSFAKDAAPAPAPYRVERSVDGARVVRLRPDETEEWRERERARRARQRPPKPTAKAKTRGKKVRKWDGEETDD